MRTIIDIPNNLISVLAEIGKSENKSRAALIREAIVHYLQSKTSSCADQNASFGIWKKKKVDSLNYQRKLRQEWE